MRWLAKLATSIHRRYFTDEHPVDNADEERVRRGILSLYAAALKKGEELEATEQGAREQDAPEDECANPDTPIDITQSVC